MNVISISAEAFLLDMFVKHYHELPLSILKHMVNIFDSEVIPDNAVVDSENVRKVVRWDKFEKMKLIRILIRCLDRDIDVLDKIKPQLKKFDYKVKDLVHLLGRRPHYIEHFPIDLDKLKTGDAAAVLALGDDYFIDKIDLSKYKFNFKESMAIIQGYNYDREIIKQVNYKSLKGYQISEIITYTGELNLDLLDISKMTNIDWIGLLSHNPNMLEHCNYNKFMSGDIFYSIKLCCMFDTPDLSHLVIDRDMSKISPFGWEKLLIEKPEKFLAHCDFNKLDENNWKCILEEHPEFHVYKV